eukprot:UN30358
MLAIGIILLPFYFVLWLFYGHPKHVFGWRELMFFSCRPCCAHRRIYDYECWERLGLIYYVLFELCSSIMHGFAWNLDKFLYPNYQNVDESRKPIFCIQGQRCGSTSFSSQLHRLVEDEYVVMGGPFMVQPYIWLHRLCKYLCCCMNEEGLVKTFAKMNQGTCLAERYKVEYNRADTF